MLRVCTSVQFCCIVTYTMASRSPLAQYILDGIHALGETPEQFAVRIGINSSGFHKFMRGDYREPRQATLDKIAGGLGKAPADLLVAIGKGSADADIEEAEILALFRSVPTEQQSAAKSMLRGLAVATLYAKTQPSDVAKGGGNGISVRSNPDETRPHNSLRDWYSALWRPFMLAGARL